MLRTEDNGTRKSLPGDRGERWDRVPVTRRRTPLHDKLDRLEKIRKARTAFSYSMGELTRKKKTNALKVLEALFELDYGEEVKLHFPEERSLQELKDIFRYTEDRNGSD